MASEPTNHQPTDHQAAIDKLVDLGTDIATRIHARILAAAEDTTSTPEAVDARLATLTVAFDRISRSVRRSVLLKQHLAKPERHARHRVLARKQVIRKVENRIHDKHQGPAAETARAELQDRLETEDLEHDLEDRPIGEIIKEICQDLGLDDFPGTTPWLRRSAKDIERLCARAAHPSSAVAQQAAVPWPPDPRRRPA